MNTHQKFNRLSCGFQPLWLGLLGVTAFACSALLADDSRQCNAPKDCNALGPGPWQCDAPTGLCTLDPPGDGGGAGVDQNMSMSGETMVAAGASGQAGDGTVAAGSGGGPTYVLPAYVSDGATPSVIPGVRNAGKEFSVVGTGVRVRDLGIWDDRGNGLRNEHTVTLFALERFGSPQGEPVPGGSTTIPRGTIAPLEAGYRYAPLPATIELSPGKYAVVAFGLDTLDPPADGGGIPLAITGVADANFDPFQFIDAASPAFPATGDANEHANASFRYESPVKPLRILSLGGSITNGVKGTLAGYRGPLKNLLDAAGIAFQYVGSKVDNPGTLPREQRHHDGHPQFLIASPDAAGRDGLADPDGKNTSQPGLYDSRVQLLGPTGSQADLILIVIGTDDVDQDNQLDTAGNRLDALVTAILDPAIGLQPNAKVILAQIPPFKDPAADQRCVAYNEALRSVAQAHQDQSQAIITVDLHSALATADLADNTRPNDAGYAKIAKVFFDAIRAIK